MIVLSLFVQPFEYFFKVIERVMVTVDDHRMVLVLPGGVIAAICAVPEVATVLG
jgi:hypothetical protein